MTIENTQQAPATPAVETTTRVDFIWQSSTGAIAMSFNDEAQARTWKEKQDAFHAGKGTTMPNLKLKKVTTTVVAEEI